jgi:MFS family permease
MPSSPRRPDRAPPGAAPVTAGLSKTPMTLTLIGRRLGCRIPGRGAGRTLALVTLIDSIGTGLFLTSAAIFFVRSIGLTAAQVGVGLSVGGAVGFATTLPIGVLGDRLGPRRLLVLCQLWRAGCLVALVFVSGAAAFTAVAAAMAIAETATPSLTQAVVAYAVDGESRVRSMAILRSTRNAGFSVGALLAVPLIAVGSEASFDTIILGDAVSFAVAALILAKLPLSRADTVRPLARFLTVLASFRDWRYAGLASLNSVLSLHMTVLTFGIPLWLIHATRAPVGLVAVFMVLNTVMAVALQIPMSTHATVPGGAPRVLRRAGLMLAGCSGAIAAAAYVSSWLAAAFLVLATALLSLGEIWQAAGAWELSYRYADPRREVQYLAVFSLGVTAQDIFGPVLVTAMIIGAGTAGWMCLAALFLAATILVSPVTRSLDRARRPAALHDSKQSKEEPCFAPMA